MQSDKTPRKLMKDAPSLVPEAIHLNNHSDSRNMIKGFLSTSEPISERHKDLLTNPVFVECGPRIVSDVFFLERYMCDTAMQPRRTLSDDWSSGVTSRAATDSQQHFEILTSPVFAACGAKVVDNVLSLTRYAADLLPNELEIMLQTSGKVATNIDKNGVSSPRRKLSAIEQCLVFYNVLMFFVVIMLVVVLLLVMVINAEHGFADPKIRKFIQNAPAP
jgi:hypothetical protein